MLPERNNKIYTSGLYLTKIENCWRFSEQLPALLLSHSCVLIFDLCFVGTYCTSGSHKGVWKIASIFVLAPISSFFEVLWFIDMFHNLCAHILYSKPQLLRSLFKGGSKNSQCPSSITNGKKKKGGGRVAKKLPLPSPSFPWNANGILTGCCPV